MSGNRSRTTLGAGVVEHSADGSLAKAGTTSEFGRFACPFSRAFSATPSTPKTCHNSFPDIRHVKEHLKKVHRCNCRLENHPAECESQLHMKPEQFEKVANNGRRAKDESPCEQWVRLFQELFPGRDVPAPHIPTVQHLEAISRDPPPGFVEELEIVLVRAEPGDAGIDGSGSRARPFLRQFPHFVELVSTWGTRRGSVAAAHNVEGSVDWEANDVVTEDIQIGESPSQDHFNEAWPDKGD